MLFRSQALGFAKPQDAIGKFLYVAGGNKSYPIAGVIADFHENSFHERIGPVYIAHEPARENGIAIRLATKGQQAGDVKENGRSVARAYVRLVKNKEGFSIDAQGSRACGSDQSTGDYMGLHTDLPRKITIQTGHVKKKTEICSRRYGTSVQRFRMNRNNESKESR